MYSKLSDRETATRLQKKVLFHVVHYWKYGDLITNGCGQPIVTFSRKNNKKTKICVFLHPSVSISMNRYRFIEAY